MLITSGDWTKFPTVGDKKYVDPFFVRGLNGVGVTSTNRKQQFMMQNIIIN